MVLKEQKCKSNSLNGYVCMICCDGLERKQTVTELDELLCGLIHHTF